MGHRPARGGLRTKNRKWQVRAFRRTFRKCINLIARRLEKLDRAGLLGKAAANTDNPDVANDIGGVVLTRAGGIDPAVTQALRALISSDREWQDSGESIGNFAEMVSAENEQAARTVARRAMELELESKPTTIEEDANLLKVLQDKDGVDYEEVLAVKFRLEKKRLLQETISRMR